MADGLREIPRLASSQQDHFSPLKEVCGSHIPSCSFWSIFEMKILIFYPINLASLSPVGLRFSPGSAGLSEGKVMGEDYAGSAAATRS